MTPAQIKVNLPDGEKVIEVGLDNIMKMANATVDFLKSFENYITDGPPGFSFTPWLVVPENLRKAIRYLENTGVNEPWKKIKDEVAKREDELNEYIDWFKLLHSSNVFVFAERDLRMGSKKYRKKLEHPMVFIRKWIQGINLNDWRGAIPRVGDDKSKVKGFVDALINGLRRAINRTFMDGAFGDI